ncbi:MULTISPECIES: copper chaperone PCu(A)C [Kordiimonas]|jgi:hypothetical protein|uniref:copper chaperone PCu(A)C n=1 Tax=Kordiimonas TaxID=288021 RepID=UPI00257C0E37|nr:copper chaperone PCu(A)C [Kordiimonas sp. UBA4487]
MKKLLLALLVTLGLALPALAHGEHEGEGIEVEKVWARKTSRTVSAAVYLTITNNTHDVIELTGASTDIASTTMIHRSYEEDGIMKMDHVMSVPLKPGETFAFAPGGYHVMLMGLTGPLKKGEVFPLTLEFEGEYEREVIVEITGMMGMQ